MQELKWKTPKNIAYRLVLHAFISALSFLSQDWAFDLLFKCMYLCMGSLNMYKYRNLRTQGNIFGYPIIVSCQQKSWELNSDPLE